MSFSASTSGNKKVNQLVAHIKQLLEQQSKDNNKDNQKTIRHIQNQIDGKQNQIRQLFARNIDSVTQHYTKYNQVCQHQKRLETMCQEFEKKIQKTQKLSQYDEKMIERSEQTLQNMARVKNLLHKYREYIRLIKKTTMNLNQEKYNNAIKLYHKAKYMQIQNIQKTPLIKCLPIIKLRIQEHLQKLMDIFWQQNSSKQLQLGTGCFGKILMNQKQKVNIYQAFFGGNKGSRLSAIGRNSLFRNSFVRQTTIQNNKQQSTIGFLKSAIEDTEALQKFILRANVEMAPLKQVKFLCQELQNDKQGSNNFQKLVKDNIFKNLKKIHENSPCQNQQDYKRILSYLIGFLLVCRQVTSHFLINFDQNLFIGQIYTILRKQLKSIINTNTTKFSIQTNKQIKQGRDRLLQVDQSKSILKLKQFSDIFYFILQLLKIQRNPRAYTLLLEDLLKTFCTMTLEKYEAMITHQISNDNLIVYKAQSAEQQESLRDILRLQEFKSNKNEQFSYNFTGFVVFIITLFDQFYQNITILVKDSNCNKSLLHEQLASILERILSLYGSELIIKDHPLHIAQGQINLLYCQKIYRYYSNKLQTENNYSRTTEPTYEEKLSQLIIELRRRIRQLVELKIELMEHTCKNQSHAAYIEWLMQYVKNTVNYMKEIRSTFVQEVLYSVVTYLSFFYWEYLKEQKQFSLITIYNLDIDLNFIYKFIGKNLGGYQGISQKLRSLQQFYSLMLTNNINDISDPQKRQQSYGSIDLQLLVLILRKYNRVDCNGLRDLKKRDVQQVMKKLEIQINGH